LKYPTNEWKEQHMKKIGPNLPNNLDGKKLATHKVDNRAPETKPKKSGQGGVGSGSGIGGSGWLGKGK
jgi:hypothetical protein